MNEPRYNIEYQKDLVVSKDWIRVRISTERGQVLRFVAQYETRISDEIHAVVRYDCAHDFIHRDILNFRGEVVDKQPVPEQLNRNVALNDALLDLRTNWERYLARFVAGMVGA
jgi:hypothetical protein